MLKSVFSRMTKWSFLRHLIFKEIDDLIIGSMGIVCFISFFFVVSSMPAQNGSSTSGGAAGSEAASDGLADA